MVGTVVAMKTRLMWSGLMREKWKIVLFAIGGLYGLGMLALLYGLSAAAGSDGQADQLALGVALVGLVIMLGWLVFPVMGFGLDSSLDPRRLAPFVDFDQTLANALVVATLVGPGAVATFLASLAPAIGWFAQGEMIPGILAILSSLAYTYLCACLARWLSTTLGAKMTRSSTGRDRTALVSTLIVVLLFAPMGLWMQMLRNNLAWDSVTSVFDLLQWTPLATALSIPLLAYRGAWVALALQVVYAVILTWGVSHLWRRSLLPAVVGSANPITEDVTRALTEGRYLVDENAASQQASHDLAAVNVERELPLLDWWKKLGFSNPTSAIAARTTHTWMRDPRLSASLLSSVLFPILAVASTFIDSGGALRGFSAFMLLLPLSLGQTIGILVSYDSTAVWAHVAAPASGWADRGGRVLGSLPIVGTLNILAGIAAGYFHLWGFDALTWIFVMLTVLFIAIGATSTFTGRFTFGVQPPGASPLATKGAGNQWITMILTFALWIVCALLITPIVIIYFLVDTDAMRLLTLCGGLVFSIGILFLGLWIGAKVWEHGNVALLKLIRNWPDH